MYLRGNEYVYVSRKQYDFVINLLRKYDVCCIESVNHLVGKYTFKKDYYSSFKGDVILHFELSRSDIYNNKYFTLGEKLFEFIERESVIEKRLRADGLISTELDYKTKAYIRYMFFKALPFTEEEYHFIHNMEQFDYDDFRIALEDEGMVTVEELLEYEEVDLEPFPPEEEYLDKINELYAIIDNEVEDKVLYPEDENISLVNVDLLPVENELIDVIRSMGIDTYGYGEHLLFIDIIREHTILQPLHMEGLDELYSCMYEDSETFKIKLARELRRKETKCLY